MYHTQNGDAPYKYFRSRELLAKSAQSAVMRLVGFPPSESKRALIELADYVFSQLY